MKSLLLWKRELDSFLILRKPEAVTAAKSYNLPCIQSGHSPYHTNYTAPSASMGQLLTLHFDEPKSEQQVEEKLLNVLVWLLSLCCLRTWDIQKLSKRRLIVFGAFRKAYLYLLMIHKSLKWCIWIKLPNRQQSLNYIIWKKVKRQHNLN